MTDEEQIKPPFYALDPLVNDATNLIDNNDEYSDKLYQFIAQAICPPYALSIDGNWGSGKTTQMLALKQKFEAQDYPVFWFNPWEFEQADDILHAFLSQLTRTSQSNWDKAIKTTGIMALTVAGTAIDLISRLATGNKLNLKNTEYIADKAEADFNKFYDDFDGKYKDEHPLEVLKQDFCHFTEQVYQSYQQKPLIVFLDDLDRCLPENALTLLEAIKNLFVIKEAKVVFICGIDTHIARQFIIKRYEGLEATFAHSYFKKIFNFTVNVPSLTNVNYIDLLQQRYQEVKSIFADSQLPENFEHLMTEDLKTILITAGVQSIRQIYNIQQNCLFYFLLNSKDKTYKTCFLDVVLLTIKECWPATLETLQKEARRNNKSKLIDLLESCESYRKEYQFKLLVVLTERTFHNYNWKLHDSAEMLLKV